MLLLHFIFLKVFLCGLTRSYCGLIDFPFAIYMSLTFCHKDTVSVPLFWFFKVIMIDSVASDTDKVNEEKVGKLRIITSYTCNLFQNYFKGKKYDGFLFNWKKILLIILC